MADKNFTQEKIDFEPAIIAAAESKSAAVDLRGMTLCGVTLPAAFTGESVSFEASVDKEAFVPVYDSTGVQITVVVAASRYVPTVFKSRFRFR